MIGEPFSPYKRFIGVFIPDALVPFRGINAAEKICLARLFRYCGKAKKCWPSQEELAEELGVEVRSVHTYIQHLEEQGFIKIQQRGLGKTNEYVMLEHAIFHEDQEDAPLIGNNLPVQEGRSTVVPDRQDSSGPLRLLTEESHIEESHSARARGDGLDFDTFLQRWNRHRGFRKPNKALRDRAEPKWQADIGDAELNLALDGYFTSDWARKENYPILGFIKDPRSWIVRSAPEVESLPAPIELPPVVLEPLVPAPTRLPYWAEVWNQSVTAGAPVRVWRPSNKLAVAYNIASQDDTFGNSAGLIFAKCQELLTHAPEKATFITFAYAIENWPKLMNGECNWVLMENSKKASKVVPKKSLAEIMREGRNKDVHSRV